MIMDEYESGIEQLANTIGQNDANAGKANAAGAAFLRLVHNPTLIDDLTEAQRAAIFSDLCLLGEPAQSSDPADHY
jgi:hypothetical protein